MASIWIKGSKNLFDIDVAKNLDNWDRSATYYKLNSFVFKKGVHYTLTMSENRCNKMVEELGIGQIAVVIHSADTWGGYPIANNLYPDYNKTKVSIYNENEDLYLRMYCSGNPNVILNFDRLFVDMQITEGEEEYPYEPYQTTTKVSAWVKSANLVNVTDRTVTTTNGYYSLTYPSPYVSLEKDVTYTLSWDYVINSSMPNSKTDAIGYGLVCGGSTNNYQPNGSDSYYDPYESTSGRAVITFTPSVGGNVYFWFIRYQGTGTADVDISNVMLNKGEEALPYEPYGVHKKLKMKVKEVV